MEPNKGRDCWEPQGRRLHEAGILGLRELETGNNWPKNKTTILLLLSQFGGFVS